MLIDTDAIVAGGYGLHLRGGSTSLLSGAKAIKLNDRWTRGLDLSAATFTSANQEAISLAANQRIHLGGGAYLWFDGTNVKVTAGGAPVNLV